MTWPKLKRDWSGLRVKVKYPIQTRGGKKFGRGTVMTVVKYYRGLKLICRHGTITRVHPRDVTLLPPRSCKL